MSGVAKRNGNNMFPTFFKTYFGDNFMNEFFDSDLPAVNVKENKKEFKLEISTPGFDKGDVEVNVDKNILTISAKKEAKKEEKDEDDRVLRQEFSSSSFYRSFTLPDNINTEKIAANQKNGILKISLPKMEKALENKKKKIEIK